MKPMNPYRMLGRFNHVVSEMVSKYNISFEEETPDWHDLFIKLSETPGMSDYDKNFCIDLAHASNKYLHQINSMGISGIKPDKENDKGIAEAKFIMSLMPDYAENILDENSMDVHRRSFFSQLFSFEGRLRRSHFLLTVLLYFILFFTAFGIMGLFKDTLPELGYVLGIPLILLGIWIMVAARTKRCHDRGRSGYWQLYTLIPYVGSIFAVIIAFGKGDDDHNIYGPNPRHL